MNDQQLLIQAAQAAGIAWRQATPEGLQDQRGGLWNPLTCDGTALRLAVTLALEIRPPDLSRECVEVRWSRGLLGTGAVIQSVTPPGFDYHVATRRAIVRAAAQRGQSSPRTRAWYTTLPRWLTRAARVRRDDLRASGASR